MHINEAGLALLKSFESCKLSAYLDVGGIPTVGWGSTGPDIHMGLTFTQEQADHRLDEDLKRFECRIQSMLHAHTSANEFSALVCFAYNVGLGALQGSTLLKKLNAGDYPGAAEEFKRWNKVNGEPCDGLTRRRKAEHDLFVK